MAFNGLVTAFRTLTFLPVPGRETDNLASSLPWFPVAGLFMGFSAVLAGRLWIYYFECWPAGCAVVLLIGLTLLTRGLHLDGLADWADALGGGPERESRLAIMKEPSLGAFGVLSLCLVLLAKWVALERLIDMGSPYMLALPFILSRTMMAELASVLPYARNTAGTGEPFVRGASKRIRFSALAIGLLFSLPWGVPGILLFGVGWATARLFALHCRKVFGGVTGDLLGALNEILEVLLLFTCVWALPGHVSLWYRIHGLF